MTAIIQHIFEFLKLTPRYFITLGGAAAFLLFIPERFTKYIGVYELTKNNRPIIGMVFILATALFIVTMAIEIATFIKRWWRNRKFSLHTIERLNSLTEDEKQILRYYVALQTKTNVLRIDDGVVQGLVSAGIIYRSADMGNLIEGFSYNISDLAWDYLYVNKHLLNGSTNFYRTDKRDRGF